jgi:uncharacterized protein (DUF927 family)
VGKNAFSLTRRELEQKAVDDITQKFGQFYQAIAIGKHSEDLDKG